MFQHVIAVWFASDMLFHFCLGKVLTSAQAPQVVGVQRILAQASWYHVVNDQIMISQCDT
jgi:hypothetical protein